MSVLQHRRCEEEIALYYSGFYGKFFDSRFGRKTQYPKIRTFLTPNVYQKKQKRKIDFTNIGICIDDTISRATIWKTLFGDRPLPNIEENAVEKYAGSLDQYLSKDVPIDKIVRHAKG